MTTSPLPPPPQKCTDCLDIKIVYKARHTVDNQIDFLDIQYQIDSL